jgi:hypothetical protein
MSDCDGDSTASSESVFEEFDDESCEASPDESSGVGSSKMLHIVVKIVGNGEGDVLDLKVDHSASVLNLKHLIADALKHGNNTVPVDRQRLVFFGRMLRDNDELLGEKGVKMKTESINYVHLSPLPEGSKPSRRPSKTTILPSIALHDPGTSLEPQLERARRLGAAARERRRRRRPQPYPFGRSSRDVPIPADGEESQHSAPRPQEQPSLYAFAGSTPLHMPLSEELFTLPTTRHLSSLLTPVSYASPMSPLTRISHLSSSIAAATREAQTASLLVNSHIMDQARQSASDLVCTLTILQAQLRHISTSYTIPGSGEYDVRETISMLDRVSQQTSSLAIGLRSVVGAAPFRPSPLAAPSQLPPMTASSAVFEQLLTETDRNGTIMLPDGRHVLLRNPPSWTRMH